MIEEFEHGASRFVSQVQALRESGLPCAEPQLCGQALRAGREGADAHDLKVRIEQKDWREESWSEVWLSDHVSPNKDRLPHGQKCLLR